MATNCGLCTRLCCLTIRLWFPDPLYVSGVAWAQGQFVSLVEPCYPPFLISGYSTDSMGEIAALSGLHRHTTKGRFWHSKVSLLQYELLLFANGQYPEEIQAQLRTNLAKEFLTLRHSHSVDDISGTGLTMLKDRYPKLFKKETFSEKWFSKEYNAFRL
jgi:hypothetical protein